MHDENNICSTWIAGKTHPSGADLLKVLKIVLRVACYSTKNRVLFNCSGKPNFINFKIFKSYFALKITTYRQKNYLK